jgi:exopolyphosphatase/guanosine-5'-triphosphate,3'-diphosphate pyrophosphatase
MGDEQTDGRSAAQDGPVAALDCGTNSTRLLIADPTGSALVREMRITRLGEGVDATHRLSPDAMRRTLDVLADYRAEMDRHGVMRARLAATSAVRDAENGAVFLDAAHTTVGVIPELLSGIEEGRLSFAGATADVEPGEVPGQELVVDIGGGSTEIVAGTPGHPEDVVAVSLDVGCVRITERFLSTDPLPDTAVENARSAVRDLVGDVRDRFPALVPGRLIGLAGTVSTLASLEAGLSVYDREKIHHAVLSREVVESWLARLAAEGVAERAAHPGMVPGRADVILGGVVVLAVVMDTFDRSTCLVSESDILDGLVASLR